MIVRSTTVEIIVPESVIDSVYGENGCNLVRLRQVDFFLSFMTSVFRTLLH